MAHPTRSARKVNELRRALAAEKQKPLPMEEQRARAEHTAKLNAAQHAEVAARIALEKSQPARATKHATSRAFLFLSSIFDAFPRAVMARRRRR
jgi:hypothetical protein